MWHLKLDDSSASAVGLAPNHKAASMALDGDSCLVHDVCAHGVQNSHLATSQEHLNTPAAAHTHIQIAMGPYTTTCSCEIRAVAASGTARTQMVQDDVDNAVMMSKNKPRLHGVLE